MCTCNATESTAMAAQQQSPRLQQVKIFSNATVRDIETKGRSCLPWEGLQQAEIFSEICCLHCQPLNEVWEGVNPGSTPSSHSGVLHMPELPWVGPAFLPGVQSLIQAVTWYFHYSKTSLLMKCLLHVHLSEQMLSKKKNLTILISCMLLLGNKRQRTAT